MRIIFGNSTDNIEIATITIYELKKLIQEKKNIPIDEIHIVKYDNVYYQNKDLVENHITLTMKQVKNRCNLCFSKAAAIIGHCKFCRLNYCASHRLPETHTCPHMADCKKQSFMENSNRVLSQKCVAVKI